MDSTLDEAVANVTPPTGDDLSAIAWVQEELRRSLDAAHKALRRFIKDAEAVTGSDLDHVDPGVLRTARSQIHQGVGALELVGLPAAAIVLRASEAAVQRSIARPQALTPELVADIERSSFALLDFLSRVLGGKNVSPLSLFPQYRAVQEAVEAERVHPADLWTMDWRWREIENDPNVVPRTADSDIRSQLESHLLQLMRGMQALTAAAKMSDLAASLAAGSAHPQVRSFWNLAAAMFEAQHHGLLGFDVFTKRVASRLLAQFRILQRGDSDVSERLARDLLFFCAQAAPGTPGLRVPRLTAARAAYGLPLQAPTDYSLSVLGRFDPAIITHAKKRVIAAKEAWSATAGGEMHRISGLAEQFALVGDSLRRLFPYGESFAAELQTAVAQTQAANAAPPAPLAMEVATSLLYIEAALEDGDFDDPDHADRVRRLGERLAAVRQEAPPEPLEPWMEELYRRVSDRQTMGSVVQELRASLSVVEKAIDDFFRNPADAGVLVDVPTQFASMRGVLSVLGMDQASQALLRMRDEVHGLVSTEVDPARIAQAGVFDRLAGNLSALGFMIDMLSVQPQLAKSLFVFDAEAGTLAPVMGRADSAKVEHPGPTPVEPRLIEQAQLLAFSSVRDDVPLQEVTRELERLSHEAQAADQPTLAAAVLKAQEAIVDAADDPIKMTTARGELSEALVDFVATATEPMGFEPLSEPAPLAPMKPIALIGDLEHDDEMRDIFLEEAREVIEGARAATAGLLNSPDDLGLLTTLRRAFHTLKGSSRMVGLKAFGEAAWAGEQVFNTQLADQRAAEPALVEFANWVFGHLSSWVDDIAAHRDTGRNEGEVKMAADRVARRLQMGEASSDIALPLGLPEDLPSAADLHFGDRPRVAAQGSEPSPEVAFELDLSGLERFEDQPAAPVDLPVIDIGAAAMFDRFDDSHEDTAQTTLTNSQFDEVPSGTIDLDLGGPFESAPMIELLAPTSVNTGIGSIDGLQLDLSSGEALPAATRTAASRPMPLPELPVAHDEPPFHATEHDKASAAAADEEAIDVANADEHVKIVGPLRIGIPLFNIYLNEADELSRRLMTEVAEWAMELHRPLDETPIALAHSLAGSSATVGFSDLSHLARALEHALARSQVIGHGTDEEARLFVNAAEEIRRLLHQFAAGFLKEPEPQLMARLAEHELSSAKRLEAVTAASELAGGVDSESPPDTEIDVDTLISLDIDEAPAEAVAESSQAAQPEPPAMDDEAVAETARATLPVALDEVVPHDDAPTPDAGEEPPEAGMSAFGALAPFGTLGVSELKPLAAAPTEVVRPAHAAHAAALGDVDDDIDAVDAVDLELFPIFEEEALELLPKLATQLRDWAREPTTASHANACMRVLHTLKGGARLAGAMRLGEMAHRLETRIERLTAGEAVVDAADVEILQTRSDAMTNAFDALRSRDAQAYADAVAAAVAPVAPIVPVSAVAPHVAPVVAIVPAAAPTAPAAAPAAPAVVIAAVPPPAPEGKKSAKGDRRGKALPADAAPASAPRPQAAADLPAIDWSRFTAGVGGAAVKPAERAQAAAQSAVRVRAPLLDRLVNQAGEVSITRSRIESGVGQIKGSLADLTENLERLRGQLRDIELQGEVQMTSRLEAAKAASQAFDPLEFDRFTRFQELTRMMAESVNDVATVQRTLQRSLETTEDELVAQARLTRDLQDDLLRTRMIEFEGLS
ncbi:MAG: Hpt domain-containing protein, partial [Caldimonas sp.]